MTEVFPIVPAQSRFMWWLVALVFIILALVMAILVKSANGARSSRFEVSDAGLRLRGDLYGRMIPASALRGREARVVDLRVERTLTPASRRAGTAVPGYNSGWFRLQNGEKALLYLTDRTRAVYMPTNEGYSVLLSPRNPEQFVARLRAIGAKS